MKTLFIVSKFETKKFKKGEYEDGSWYVVINGNKIYVSQFDYLMLLNGEVVVVTEDETMIDYYRQEIKDFYKNYCKGD